MDFKTILSKGESPIDTRSKESIPNAHQSIMNFSDSISGRCERKGGDWFSDNIDGNFTLD